MSDGGRDHTAQEVCNVLSRFSGPSICKYSEETAKTSSAKVQLNGDKGITASHELLRGLHEVQPNLSFTKMLMKHALRLMFDECAAKDEELEKSERGWASKMSAAQKEDWEETMQRRIRNLCRVVAQAQVKARPAAWVRSLPWHAGSSTIPAVAKRPALATAVLKRPAAKRETVVPADEVASEHVDDDDDEDEGDDMNEDEESDEGDDMNEDEGDDMNEGEEQEDGCGEGMGEILDEMFAPAAGTGTKQAAGTTSSAAQYCFSTELMLPWRRVGATGRKEPGLPISVPAAAGKSELVVGEWPDGEKHVLENFTYEDLDLIQPRSKNQGPDSGNLVDMEAATTKHRIVVCQKIDRKLLLIVQEQSKQVLMLRVNLFGEVPNEKERLDPKHPTMQAALTFIMPIVERFASGELARSSLSTARDEALKEGGFGKSKKAAAKTKSADAVAAATSSTTASKRPAAASTKPPPKKLCPAAAFPSCSTPVASASSSSSAPPPSASVPATTSAAASSSTLPPVMDTFGNMMAFFDGQ
jgi:hypothetical protein